MCSIFPDEILSLFKLLLHFLHLPVSLLKFQSYKQPIIMTAQEAKLFVGQLNQKATEEDVRQLFNFYGEVRHVNIVRKNGESTGSAFVTYPSSVEADAAILALHNKYNMERERPLQVSYAMRTGVVSPFGLAHSEKVSNENPSNPKLSR